jgi:hypothetical protein
MSRGRGIIPAPTLPAERNQMALTVDPLVLAVGLDCVPLDPEDVDLDDLLFWCCAEYDLTLGPVVFEEEGA